MKWKLILFMALVLSLIVWGSSEVVATAEPLSIKSVQNGTLTPAAATTNVIINSVNTSQALVNCYYRTSASAPNQVPTCRLTNATYLNITTGGATSGTIVTWYIVEFASGANIQRGEKFWGTGTASENITINSVNLSATFVILMSRASTTTTTIDEERVARANMTNSTNLYIRRGETGITAEYVWQVIELSNASVQSGDTAISGVRSAAAVINAVNLSNTFLVFSVEAASASGGTESEYYVEGNFSNTTGILFKRESATNSANVSWFAVSVTNATVQPTTHLAATTQVNLYNTTLQTVNFSNAAPFISSTANGTTADQDSGNWAYRFDNTTGINFSRSSTQNVRSNVSAFIVQWPIAAADTTPPQWSNNYINSTTPGSTINHSVNWTDTALSGFIFSFDNGNGSFLNDTWVSMIGTANQSNATKVVTSIAGTTIRWIVYANDSSNGFNATDTFQYTVGWWNTSFANRIKITFNNTDSAENLINFPTLVLLNSTRINYSLTQNSGQDIRFIDADNTTSLPYEIEIWNESNYSYVWVKVPQIDAGSTGDYIWMYYNNATTGDAQNITGTWNANYKGVWHLKNGTTLNANDSTSNSNNGTINNGTAAATGKVDGAGSFDGTDDNINLGGSSSLNISGNITVSGWVFDKEGAGFTGGWFLAQFKNDTMKKIMLRINTQDYGTNTFADFNHGHGNGTYYGATGTTNLTANTWYYVTGVYNNTNLLVYLNGVNEGTSSQIPSNLNTDGANIFLGLREDLSEGTGNNFNGSVDEVRMSNVAHSADWIFADYLSQSDTYNAFGAEESAPEPLIEFISPTPANATTTSNTSIQINVSIVESNLENLTYNWNTTNYTLYNDSLVLMMNFDNLTALGEGANNFSDDVSGYNNNGTCVGMINGLCNYTTGKYGNALFFDGVDDKLNLSTMSRDLSMSNALTVSAWIKPLSTSGYMRIVEHGAIGSSPFLEYALNLFPASEGTTVALEVTTGGVDTILGSNTSYSTNAWTHLVGTWDGSIMRIYFNGIEDANRSLSGTITEQHNRTTIGYRDAAGSMVHFFNGSIDEVRVWNRSLTANEISQLYMSNLQKFNSTQWYLYVNQSKNATAGLDAGTYTYYTYASDVSSNANQTDTRYITVGQPQIQFISPTPANATTTSNTSIQINVSIVESNLENLTYNWNTTNYTLYNDSLVLMMNFDNITAIGEGVNNFSDDVSGYNNNGTCKGMNPGCNYTTGKYANGMGFDGSNDYVDAGSAASLDNLGPLTFSAWIYPNSLAGDEFFVIAKPGDGGACEGCRQLQVGDFFGNSDQLIFYSKRADSSVDIAQSVNNTITTGSWQYIVGTWDGSNAPKLYKNGAEVSYASQAAGTGALNSDAGQNMTIGSRGAGNFFNGTIDEVRIYNRVLSANEIQQLYMSNLQKFNSTQWYLYVNQSKNATTVLDTGNYTYYTYASANSGLANQTDTRYITVAPPQTQFISPTPANATTTSNTSIEINVSIVESNLENLTYNWNTTNYTFYNDSLVLMMNFDNLTAIGEGTSNLTRIVDVSNSGNNGTCIGMGTNCNYTTGKYGNSTYFDGTDDSISVGLTGIPALNSNQTISAWIKYPSTPASARQITSREDVAGFKGVSMGFHTLGGCTGMSLGVWGYGGPFDVCTSTIPTANTWHHFVYTYNGTTHQLYLDGSEVNKSTTAIDTGTATAMKIGAWAGGNDEFWLGSIDEVRIWNRSLTANEISQLYMSNLQKFNSTQWYLYVNQSKNATTVLDTGNYTYYTYASANSGLANQTDLRYVTITAEAAAPQTQFISPTPANATTTANTSIEINVSIVESNLENLTYNWNTTNYTLYNDSLVLMMNFDNITAIGEGTNNLTRVVDVSGYGNNGTCIGMGTNCNYTTGKYGNATSFDGVNDYVDTARLQGIEGVSQLTYSMWFKRIAVNARVFLSKTTATGSDANRIVIEAWTDGMVYLEPSNGNTSYGYFASNDTNWHHVVMVFDGTQSTNPTRLKGYLDGVEQTLSFLGTIGSTTSAGATGNLFIGALNATEGMFYTNGTIDEVRIWNRSLTADEVSQLYMSNLQKFNSTQWYLYVNQSKNATAVLDTGTYTYYTYASANSGLANQTDTRYITVAPPQTQFISPTPANATTTSNTSIEINVSIVESNLENLTYNWNTTNYTLYNDSLVLMMNFDNLTAIGEGTSNLTRVVDVSNSGNNGTCIGMGTNCNYTTGKYGNATSFDGTDDAVNFGTPNALNLSTNFTISTWVKVRSFVDLSGVVGKGPTGANPTISIRADSNAGANQFLFRINDGTNNAEDSWAGNSINTWYHVVMVVGARGTSGVLGYVDGVQRVSLDTSAVGIITSSSNWYVGWNERNNKYFNGSIDEVRIWNRSLTADEVSQLYMSNLQKFNSTQWYLYVNQSKNATAVLDTGTYTYYTYASANSGLANQTDTRYITISAADDCTCTDGATWLIDDGSNCQLSTTCNLGSNPFRLMNGRLVITNTGKLNAQGCYIQNAENLFVQQGGGLICR